MADKLILNGSDHTINVAGGNNFNIVGTSASEEIVVENGASVQFAAGTGDRVEVAGNLSSFNVTSAGNQLILSDAEGSDIVIALNAEMTIVFSDGSAAATMDTSGGTPVVTLGGQAANTAFDAAAVGLDESDTSSAGGGDDPDSGDETTTVSADIGSLSDPETLDAAGDDFLFIEDANIENRVEISNFASGDSIEISNAVQGDYTFEQDGSDMNIIYNNNGAVSQITLLGVADPSDLLHTEALFEGAIGFDAVTYA